MWPWWRRAERPGSVGAEIVPPRALEESIAAARGLIASLAAGQVTLEAALTAEGPRWYVCAATEAALERATAQVRAAYPHCVVEPWTGDPGRRARDGSAEVVLPLDARSDPDLPLRTDWRFERDPLVGVLSAAAPAAGEGAALRVLLESGAERVAERIRRRVEPPRFGNAREFGREGPSLLPFLGLLATASAGLQGWRWYEGGDWQALIVSAVVALVGLLIGGVLAARLRRRDPLAERVAERKLTGPLLTVQVQVVAHAGSAERATVLAEQVAAACMAYDDASGGGLRLAHGRRGSVRRSRRLALNAGEVAALWHLPDEAVSLARARRTTARRLLPAPGHATAGIRVGTTNAGGTPQPVYMPLPLLHRNQLIVAKTRRGKSTLLRHLAAGLLEELAAGRDESALVVVDPHQDLAEAVLGSIPHALVDRTLYLDFANLACPVGLNLIDVHLFPDRDRTIEHIVTMMNRLWPQNWGPRMEGALRAALATLIELNLRRSRAEQYTLLDVAPVLTDKRWREQLVAEVDDPVIRAWWRDNYDRAGLTLQQQTANPVTSKIGRFTMTEASRLVFGQPASTFDPRALIREGGVLVVNTAVGALGEGAASLVGATMLNLLGLLMEEQVALPAAERRRVVQLVDESSTLGAVDYPRMLSELGKYGASFVLVTQSLSKLDVIDPNLGPTILANSDGLMVFQVGAEDARRLVPELGSGIEIEDLVSLDDFTCYARWWDGRSRPAAFSLRVDPPPRSDREPIRRIRGIFMDRFQLHGSGADWDSRGGRPRPSLNVRASRKRA